MKGADVAAEWVSVGDLVPWDQNPRINDEAVAEVAGSIKRFGWASPIIARRADSMVIAGHTRLKAAQKLGINKVPVRWMDLDPAEARMLALADNKLNERALWDDSALAEVLAELEAEGADLEGLGWDQEELDAIIADAGPDVELPEDVEPSAPPTEPDSKQGEVYELGPHRLVCGDCRDPETVARLVGEDSIAVAFTSPPYASQRTYDESSGFKPIPPDEFVAWFEAVQANVRTHLAEDGSWFVNIKAGSSEGERLLYVIDLTLTHAREWGWRFVDEFCWLRQALPGSPESMGRFKNGWESVYHYAAGAGFKFLPAEVRHESVHAFKYEDQVAAGRDISAASQGLGNNAQSPVGQGLGLAYPSNVIEYKGGANVVGHSAAFPLALPAFFIKAYTDPGDLVFDPFLGSGTTLIAAAKEGRVAAGCELSPAYCDIIRDRWTRWAIEAGQDPGPGALTLERDDG
jgi:DNA modification methylase